MKNLDLMVSSDPRATSFYSRLVYSDDDEVERDADDYVHLGTEAWRRAR